MKIAIGCDHGGFKLKQRLAQTLSEDGYMLIDYGCYSTESVDYPDIAAVVARAVASGEADRGILICTSGQGMCMTANKIPGIRAAFLHSENSAEMSRRHNDANIICIGAKDIHRGHLEFWIDTWLETEFEGGRHQKRVDKITAIEKNRIPDISDFPTDDPIAYLENLVLAVPNFPKQGIVFRDITPLLADPNAVPLASALICAKFATAGITHVAAMESRGFLFGIPVAMGLGAGFIPVRKPGKLPRNVKKATYDLEYGTDTLELHEDALCEGNRVLVVDDLLATGGTAQAVEKLIEETGADLVSMAFVIELVELMGRKKLQNDNICSLLKY